MDLEVTRHHISYQDKQQISDTDNTRIWFIANQEPTNDNEFLEAKLLSRFWQNSRQLKCEYSAKIMKRIADKK